MSATKGGNGTEPLIPDAAAILKNLAALPAATYEPGETVIAAGDATGKLLLLKHGSVEVVKAGTHIAKISDPGAVFGELAQPDNPPELRGYAYRMMQMLHVERDAAERVRTRLDGKP